MAKKSYRMTEARKTAIAEYRKQYRRISSYARSLKKKGYKLPNGVVPAKPSSKEIQSLSTVQIKKITKEAEYKKSYRIFHKAYKEVGRQGEKRSVSAEEFEEARQKKKTSFEDERRKKDAEARARAKSDADFKERFSQGKRVYQKIIDLIYEGNPETATAKSLQRVLENEFDTYGEDKVMLAMAQAPQDLIESAETALKYRPSHESHTKALLAIEEIITGEIPSAKRVRELTEIGEGKDYFEES